VTKKKKKKNVHHNSKTPGDVFTVAAIVDTTDVRAQ
jgi:hypothetical protein